MSSYNDAPHQNTIPEALVPSTNNGMNNEQNMKLIKAIILSIPICFSLIVLFGCYVIYLCQRSNTIDWLSLYSGRFDLANNFSMVELGLRKELREVLPSFIFGESFTLNDPQCLLCLGDYQEGEKLQQISACGHIFHMECIDTWLTSHLTCPLCRVCLTPRVPQDMFYGHQTPENVPSMENAYAEASAQP